MKKWVCLLLAIICVVGISTGCGQKRVDKRFVADNEIYTYDRIDPEKTQLIVASLGNNANIKSLSNAFALQNPDVQVIRVDMTGGTPAYKPAIDWVTHGVAPDILFVNPESFVDDKLITEYLVDLSANPVVERFEAEALSRVAVDGHVYFLPAPSEINCMIYNKTLFEQYGWQVPVTFDAFVSLCNRIREDTGGTVQPWNPNAKYDNVFSTAVQALTYVELFGGAENWSWYRSFCEGQATFAGHMEPLFDMIQTLIDNGILLEEHFNYSATTRGKEFEAGKIAMYNAPISRIKSDIYTFDYMPYPTTSGEAGYVNDYFSAMLCVPQKTHNDAVQDAIARYIDFFGSFAGQQALIGDTLMVSNVKDVPLNASETLSGIESVIAQGHMFSRLDFPGSTEVNWTFRKNAQAVAASGAVERNWAFRESALAMVKGEKTSAEIIAEIDAQPYKMTGESETGAADKLARVAADFSIWEFSCYIADMYREKAGAEVGLINHGIPYRGNLVRIFAGDIYDTYMYPIKPRSFENGSTLVKVSMTGQQVLDALNHPVGNACVSNSVYAFSGLRCEIAPWNALGSKYLSVKLADGAALEPDRLYTVAIWEGSVSDAYITETLEAYEGSWETLMAAKVRADGTLMPANDGRAKLIWN